MLLITDWYAVANCAPCGVLRKSTLLSSSGFWDDDVSVAISRFMRMWYILPPQVHTKSMENNKTNATQQKKKNVNAMKKLGKSIKDTFIEMSSSLAGWIDDTGAKFSGKKSTQKVQKNNNSSSLKKASQPKKSSN